MHTRHKRTWNAIFPINYEEVPGTVVPLRINCMSFLFDVVASAFVILCSLFVTGSLFMFCHHCLDLSYYTSVVLFQGYWKSFRFSTRSYQKHEYDRKPLL